MIISVIYIKYIISDVIYKIIMFVSVKNSSTILNHKHIVYFYVIFNYYFYGYMCTYQKLKLGKNSLWTYMNISLVDLNNEFN